MKQQNLMKIYFWNVDVIQIQQRVWELKIVLGCTGVLLDDPRLKNKNQEILDMYCSSHDLIKTRQQICPARITCEYKSWEFARPAHMGVSAQTSWVDILLDGYIPFKI